MTAPSVPLRTTATTKPKPNALTAADVGLTHGELALAVERLGRTPNDLELGMLGAMWSEHCAYKHSRPLLALLPTHGHGVLAGPGANAGAVDLGGGLACVFKVESHNHPSAVEPFQGAATGVGGIIRDVFAMGARPAALLNALFFGDPARPRSRNLAGGVVGGISFYGNCVGIPDVGGHVSFLPDFDDNPLVNAMCVGIARSDRLIGADTAVPGQSVYLVGADTGRDGIAGASLLASFELGDKSDEKRPSVQVGDPFLEKLLMEACLELADHGHLSAMQDLGAAGLTCAASELAAKSSAGIEVDVRAVPRRAAGMTPYEVMLSESQERMLVVPRRGHEKNVERICARWGLHCSRVGTVLDQDVVRVRDGEAIAAEMSAKLLAEGAPTYALDAEYDRRTAAARERSPFAELPPRERLLALLSSPQLASRERIWRRYDQMVGTDTVIGPGADAAVLRIKGRPDGIAVSLDANPELARIDPYAAAAATVLEAVRNLVCVGARPLALTDCVNLGNPERAHGAWQLRRTIEGLAAASRALGVPIVSGNVSLYNASSGRDIVPTLVVGAVGRLEDVSRAIRPGIGAEGDALVVLGGQDDLAAQRALHELILAAHERHLVAAAHDVGEGGVAIAVAEMAIAGGRGASLALAEDPFASEPARIIVATPEPEALLDLARSAGVPCRHVGAVGGEHVRVLGALEVRLDECRAAHGNGLATALGLP